MTPRDDKTRCRGDGRGAGLRGAGRRGAARRGAGHRGAELLKVFYAELRNQLEAATAELTTVQAAKDAETAEVRNPLEAATADLAAANLKSHVHPKIYPLSERYHRHRRIVKCKELRTDSKNLKFNKNDKPKHANANGNKRPICFCHVMGICDNTGVCYECEQGEDLPGD